MIGDLCDKGVGADRQLHALEGVRVCWWLFFGLLRLETEDLAEFRERVEG